MGDAVAENLVAFGAPRPTKRDKEAVKDLGKEPVFDTSVVTKAGQPGRASSDEGCRLVARSLRAVLRRVPE